MPRNDQITRQWHLLRLLEGAQGKSLAELADKVPHDYPKNSRILRRDLGLGSIWSGIGVRLCFFDIVALSFCRPTMFQNKQINKA